jgi:hypothetical protein
MLPTNGEARPISRDCRRLAFATSGVRRPQVRQDGRISSGPANLGLRIVADHRNAPGCDMNAAMTKMTVSIRSQ